MAHGPDRLKTTVYLDGEAYRSLKFLARESGVAPAAMIRTAVAEFIARRHKRRLPRSLGAGRSRRGDLSTRAEELLDGFGKSK